MARLHKNFSQAAEVAMFMQVRELPLAVLRRLPIPDSCATAQEISEAPQGNDGKTCATAQTLEDFCLRVFGRSYRAMAEAAQNLSTLGEETYDTAARLGLNRSALRHSRTLPPEKLALVREAISTGTTKAAVLSVIEDLAQRAAQAVGGALMARLHKNFSQAAEVAMFMQVRELPLAVLRRIPLQEIPAVAGSFSVASQGDAEKTPATAGNLEDFCRRVFGRSYNAMLEAAQNLSILGEEAYDTAARLGLNRSALRLSRTLPPEKLALVREAISSGTTKAEVLSVIEDLAQRAAQVVGGALMARLHRSFFQAAEVAMFMQVRDLPLAVIRRIPIADLSAAADKNTSPSQEGAEKMSAAAATLDQFCLRVFGRSYNVMSEAAQNLSLLGEEAYDTAARLGLGRSTLRLSRTLPPDTLATGLAV